MKVDIFAHIFPKTYFNKMVEVAPNGKDMHKRVRNVPCIVDDLTLSFFRKGRGHNHWVREEMFLAIRK